MPFHPTNIPKNGVKDAIPQKSTACCILRYITYVNRCLWHCGSNVATYYSIDSGDMFLLLDFVNQFVFP